MPNANAEKGFGDGAKGRVEKLVPQKEDIPVSRASEELDRGRAAEKPTELPKKGWLDVVWRTKQQLDEDNLSVVAAGIAFYAFLAVVPALAVVIALYALIADAGELSRHIEMLARVVPGEVMPLLKEQMTRIAQNNTAAGISAIVGLLLAMYSSANATKALIAGLNIAYDESEKRSFVKLNLAAFALTFAGLIGIIVAVGLVGVLPAVTRFFFAEQMTKVVVDWLRWPLLMGLFIVGNATIYRFGPSRSSAQWKWVSPGAILAAILWIVGSGLFSLYVSKFGSYDKTYGSLGAVVVFLMWIYLTAYVVLLGAELNSEMERQTMKDTTSGEPEPLGARGAYAADTVGSARKGKKRD
ncbi:MAG TPA: YihY/virulence factor BrkB family protein [Opitutaceae bacterium]|nr:YihY/virulence factor BrkB family protein [Opitutaceae bacterium]